MNAEQEVQLLKRRLGFLQFVCEGGGEIAIRSDALGIVVIVEGEAYAGIDLCDALDAAIKNHNPLSI